MNGIGHMNELHNLLKCQFPISIKIWPDNKHVSLLNVEQLSN